MSSNRCFGTYTKDITSSSDYITSKKQRSIYKTLQSDSINYGGNPTKKNWVLNIMIIFMFHQLVTKIILV